MKLLNVFFVIFLSFSFGLLAYHYLLTNQQSSSETHSKQEIPRKEIKHSFQSSPKNAKTQDKVPSSLSHISAPSNPLAAVLIVGGTDGSGTRSVVKKLLNLGALMISDDTKTYDIHASIVEGWPSIVKPILQETHTINYSISSLSSHVQTNIIQSVNKILLQTEQNSQRSSSYNKKMSISALKLSRSSIKAKEIKYGFKAPVSMTLLPIWTEVIPHMRFIQVVRDGRDIAFSSNQAPVTKFYDDMYLLHNFTSTQLNIHSKAIKLWSDWNTQAFSWSSQYAEELQGEKPDNSYSYIVRNVNNTKSFGYLLVHTEDLVHDNIHVRFLALYRVAKFIQSDISNEQLCCLAVSKQQFMGSAERGFKTKKVSSRYGKWKQKVEDQPELFSEMMTYGQEGLSTLGYEPMRALPTEEIVKQETNGYVCFSENNQCQGQTYSTNGLLSMNNYNYQNLCKISHGVDFIGGLSFYLFSFILINC